MISIRQKSRGLLARFPPGHARKLSRRQIADKSNAMESFVRSSHCTEIFRAEYYRNAKLSISITPTDLDDIVIEERVRPSLLLGAFEGLGVGLGLMARISPKPISELVTRIIDDAASQQFNDAIRDIQKIDPELVNEDVKETLKYHRDLKASPENNNDSSSSHESMTANTGINSVAVDPLSVLMTPEKLKEVTFVLSSSLSNVLHFTRSL